MPRHYCKVPMIVSMIALPRVQKNWAAFRPPIHLTLELKLALNPPITWQATSGPSGPNLFVIGFHGHRPETKAEGDTDDDRK